MSKKVKDKKNNPTVKNRKARFEYHFLETFEAGMVLKGTEIKSLREGKVQMGEAFCYFKNGELWVKDMHISPYTFGNIHNVDPARERKLLLKKRELARIKKKMDQKGLTIVPTKLFFTSRGFAKLQIALAQGKKLYDKRNTIKDRDISRDIKNLQY